MSKRLIITLSIIFSAIVVVLILLWTLFGLSTVTVEYSSTTQNLSVSSKEIVKAGKFRYGASVLFEGKRKYIDNINSHAKENPDFAYIRITNIETRFPNKFVIHVVEREELFAVQSMNEQQFFICDRDFRVLRVEENFESTPENPILLEGLEYSNKDVVIGDFLKVGQTSMKKFHSVMLANNRTLSEQLGKFERMSLGSYEEEGIRYISLRMTSFAGRVFQINNIDFAFANKVQKMFAVESALYSQTTDEDGNILNAKGEPMFLMLSETGEYMPYDEASGKEKVAFTYELLSHCMIKVDNLTLSKVVKRTEKDIYYSIVEMNV